MSATTTPDRELARWTERLTEIDARLAAIAVGRVEAAAERDEAMGSRWSRAKAAVAAEHPVTVYDRKIAAYDVDEAELLADREIVSEHVKAAQKDVAERRRDEYLEGIGPLREGVVGALAELLEEINDAAAVYEEKLLPAARALAEHREKAPDFEARTEAASPLEPWPISFNVLLKKAHLAATSAEAREWSSLVHPLFAQFVRFSPTLDEPVRFPGVEVAYEAPLRIPGEG